MALKEEVIQPKIYPGGNHKEDDNDLNKKAVIGTNAQLSGGETANRYGAEGNG